MEPKTYTSDIDIDLYVLYSICECSLSLNYPEYIRKRVQSFIYELENIIFSYPKELKELDIEEHKFTCTTIFENYLPKLPIENRV